MMNQKNYTFNRTCVMCKGPLIGRSDKVFCGIKCKNKYHIEARKTQRTAMSETNKVLARNYIIIAGLLANGSQMCISKLALAKSGFNFDYVTEVRNENGQIYYGVYDLRWKTAAKNNIVVDKNRDRAPVSPFVFERWRRVYRPFMEHSTMLGLESVLATLYWENLLSVRNSSSIKR